MPTSTATLPPVWYFSLKTYTSWYLPISMLQATSSGHFANVTLDGVMAAETMNHNSHGKQALKQEGAGNLLQGNSGLSC